jgi:hypothetical protein
MHCKVAIVNAAILKAHVRELTRNHKCVCDSMFRYVYIYIYLYRGTSYTDCNSPCGFANQCVMHKHDSGWRTSGNMQTNFMYIVFFLSAI